MNIYENLQKWSKIIKKQKKNNKNEHISAQNITKPPLLPVFISSVIQFDNFFHPVVLDENYLICIFMNINEILKMREKPMGKL